MAFVDEFSQKAREFAGAASGMARDAADSVKVTASILAEQREIDKNYRAIGEWYVSQLDGEVPAAVADLVAAVRLSQQRVEELRASRQKEEASAQERKCPLCGMVSDGKFCPQCGAPMGD